MKKILYFLLFIAICIACDNKATQRVTDDAVVDTALIDTVAVIDTATIYTIDIDTIVKDGETHYYLLCEEKNEWDEILIDDTLILYKNIRNDEGWCLVCPLSLNEVIVK